ncbi:unnamed protein product [Musa textilis]
MFEPLCSPIHCRPDGSPLPIIDHAGFYFLDVAVFDTWPYEVSTALVADLSADCRTLGFVQSFGVREWSGISL